jgi:hypothetical protein
MTTVINLNIMNFFGLKPNKFAVNDVRLNTRNSDGRQRNSSYNKDRIIDVTPYCRVVADNEADSQKDVESSLDKALQKKNVMNNTVMGTIYDRKGRIIQCFQQKGMYVDSYA